MHEKAKQLQTAGIELEIQYFGDPPEPVIKLLRSPPESKTSWELHSRTTAASHAHNGLISWDIFRRGKDIQHTEAELDLLNKMAEAVQE